MDHVNFKCTSSHVSGFITYVDNLTLQLCHYTVICGVL